MDLAAAFGAAAAAAGNIVGYNRSNFFQNLNLQQSRQFRRQHIVTAQANLFRNDVQQAIGASVILQERLAVVSTLMLAVSTHSLSFCLPRKSSDFLEGLYFLSISTSFLSFMLALFCSVSASILARRSQKDLLNFWVRPPFEEMVSAVDEAAEKQSAEQFEKTSWSNVFRLPGYALLRQKFDEDIRELRRRARYSQVNLQDDGKEDGSSLDTLLMRQQLNDKTLGHLQNLWADLASYTPYFLLWGMRNLLNSFSFYALAQYFVDGLSFGYIVHFFYLILVLGMSALSETMMRTNFWISSTERVLLLVDHASAFAATAHARRKATTWSESEGLAGYGGALIVACYAAQFCVSLCLHYRFVSSTHGSSIIETLLQTDVQTDDSGSDSESDSLQELGQRMSPSSMGSFGSVTMATADLSREQSRMRDSIRTVCIVGSATIVLAWMVNAATVGLFVTRIIEPPFVHFHALGAAAHSQPLFAPARQLAIEPSAAPVDVLLCKGEVHRALRLPGSKTVGELLTMEGFASSSWQPFSARAAARDASGARVGHEVPLAALAKHSAKNAGDSLELHIYSDAS